MFTVKDILKWLPSWPAPPPKGGGGELDLVSEKTNEHSSLISPQSWYFDTVLRGKDRRGSKLSIPLLTLPPLSYTWATHKYFFKTGESMNVSQNDWLLAVFQPLIIKPNTMSLLRRWAGWNRIQLLSAKCKLGYKDPPPFNNGRRPSVARYWRECDWPTAGTKQSQTTFNRMVRCVILRKVWLWQCIFWAGFRAEQPDSLGMRNPTV